MSVICNSSQVSSCMYSSTIWSQKDVQNQWTLLEEDNDQITAPTRADVKLENRCTKDHMKSLSSKPLRDKNSRKLSLLKHVPHREKPPQVVAKRNARERRRVQAVNSAFTRLRNAIPIENTRGKRISKVKTLQNAINYIIGLQELLEGARTFCPLEDNMINHNDMKKQTLYCSRWNYGDSMERCCQI